MPTDRLRPIVSRAAMLVPLAALAACAHDGAFLGGPDNFGEANRQTMAAQVIDPDPVYDYAIPETSAEHSAQAVERYRTDKVKNPDRIKTSNTGNIGGGGGGSGGN